MPKRLARVGAYLSQPWVLAIWLLTLSILSAAVVLYHANRFDDYARCKAAWDEDMAVAVEARDQADAQDRATDRLETTAIVTLIEDAISADTDAEREAAVGRYHDTLAEVAHLRAEAADQRVANPLPDLPSTVCGTSPRK